MKKLLLLATILFIISCEPEPEDPDTQFRIVNSSTYNVELTIFNAGIPDQSPADVIFSLPSNSEKNYFYISYDNYLLLDPADSAYVKFNNEKQIIYRKNDSQSRNILDINSWDYQNGVTTEHIYTYSITNEDFDNAIEIKN